MNFPELVKMTVDIYFRYKNTYKPLPEIVIEDASSGTQLLQVLRHDYALNPHAVKPNQDKPSRMQGTSLLIEQGKLLFPNTAGAWYKDFENELTTFPKSRFKDQCDALSQASDYLTSNASLVEPRIAPRTDYYLAGHRSIYKTHPMRDPRKLQRW